MTLTWKPYRGTESVFWEAYKKEGDQTVITKLSDENGWLRTDVTVTHQGYEYTGKNVPKKDGRGYWHFVERKSALGEKDPEQVAHENTNKEYADGAKKGHEENVQMHKEEMAKITELITAINALTDAITVKRKEGGE